MFKILKDSNKVILMMAGIIALFFYRTCVRVIRLDGENDHVNLVLHLSMLLFLFWGCTRFRQKRINKSKMASCVLFLSVIIALSGIIFWIDPGTFINPLLWTVYFLIAFLYYDSNSDENVLQFSSLLICIITLITGYLSLNVGYIISNSMGQMDEYKEFLNIIGFTVTTIPAIMTMKNVPLKWGVIFGVIVVAIVTQRRMALFIVALSLLFSLIEIRNNKKGRIWLIIGFVLFVYFGANYVLNVFTDNIEGAFSRLENVAESDDTGAIRVRLWNDVFNAIDRSDFLELLLGHGSYGVQAVTNHTAAHNEMLEFYFDYGVLGLLLFVYLHIQLIKRIVWLFKRGMDIRYSYLLSYIIFVVYTTFGNVLIYPQFSLPLVMFWGYTEAKCLSYNKYVLIEK